MMPASSPNIVEEVVIIASFLKGELRSQFEAVDRPPQTPLLLQVLLLLQAGFNSSPPSGTYIT